MPLSLYSAWLNPMRGYNGAPSACSGSLQASYPSSQHLQQPMTGGQHHLQGAAYPGHAAVTARLLAAAAAANYTDDSDDDGSLSPVHDLSKSQHGEFTKNPGDTSSS